MSYVVWNSEISSCSISSQSLEQIVSTTALYNKLQGIELGVSQALLAETASELQTLIKSNKWRTASLLPGYRLRIVDGTCLAATDRRLDAIRLQPSHYQVKS